MCCPVPFDLAHLPAGLASDSAPTDVSDDWRLSTSLTLAVSLQSSVKVQSLTTYRLLLH